MNARYSKVASEKSVRETKKWANWEKWLTFTVSVLFVPAFITVLLSAFEDETNLWIHQLLGSDRQDSIMEIQKKLTSQGKVSGVECAKIGMTKADLLKNCGRPIYMSTLLREDGSSSKIGYQPKPDQLIIYDLKNDIVTSITFTRQDAEFASITYPEIKKVMGAPDDTIQLESGYSSYTYRYDRYDLVLNIDGDVNGLNKIRLEDKKPTLPKLNYPKDTGSIKRIIPGDQQLSSKSGQDLANWIYSSAMKSDLPSNPCGALSSTYDQVIKRCGTDSTSVSYNDQTKEKEIHYQSDGQEYIYSFYQDKLSYISIQPVQPLSFTVKQIKKKLGKPVREKKQPKDEMIFSSYVIYQIQDKELLFNYNELSQVTTIELRFAKMYDDQFGNLLPTNQ